MTDFFRRAYHAAQRARDRSLFRWVELPLRARASRRRLEEGLQEGRLPRIAFVKQDVQDDLYCCAPDASAREVVCSTLMRTGPVALFTRLGAVCHLVQTEPDPECSIWQQRWTEQRWTPLSQNEALKERVPGRSYGQSDYSVSAEDVDWARYDIVVSVDVSVPARITQRYPQVAWCYYVREPRTSAYPRSMEAPIDGQDLFLNQRFRVVRRWPRVAKHEVEFPYYFQYVGCFHELLSLEPDDDSRRGVFLEHHTPQHMTQAQMRQLEQLGPVECTANRTGGSESGFSDGMEKSRMTTEEILRGLMRSKYFVKCGGRSVWGNAMVEAIAAGCLAIGDPKLHGHGFIYSKHTSASSFDEVIRRLEAFEADPRLYEREVTRQRRMLDYLCFVRPSRELFEKASRAVADKSG